MTTTNINTANDNAPNERNSTQQQQQPEHETRRPTTHTSHIVQLLHLLIAMIRLLLWPARQFLSHLPSSDPSLDGLSPTVTAKAAQQFVQQLTQQQQQQQHWQTLGFTALQQQATQEGKLILLYLHAPLHRQANHSLHVFASHATALLQQVLALGLSVQTAVGTHLQHSLQVTALPALLLLQPTTTTTTTTITNMQLMVRVQGPALVQYCQNQQTLPPLMALLQTALSRHQSVLAEQRARQWQRQEDNALRQQQDAEYQAALAADQERERMAEQAAREQEERQKQELQALREKETQLQQAKDKIRPEPVDSTIPAAMLRIVLPSGQKINRRFYADDTIGTIRAFLMVYFHEHDISIQNVRLSTNFPKQHYDDDAVALNDAGLVPQAVLMVQDLDA